MAHPEEDIDVLACEFVAGTLEASERDEVSKRRKLEPDLNKAIEDWEVSLSPMMDEVAEATPRSDLLARIQQQIAGSAKSDSNVLHIEHLRNGLLRWRRAAIAASAIAACFATYIVYSHVYMPDGSKNYVAVFQENDQPPEFLLSVDLGTREVTIRLVAAENRPDGSYQLWIMGEGISEKPRSLGLLAADGKLSRKDLQQFDPRLLKTATFGISQEPKGGSPTGQPSGQALHGKLLPASSQSN